MLQALSPIEHRSLRYRMPAQPYAFARRKALTALIIKDAQFACRSMPVLFGLQDGAAALIGITGLRQDENVFVDDIGRWTGAYIPAAYRALPFGLAPFPDSGEKMVVIDPQLECFSYTDGVRLFGEEGQQTGFLQNIVGLLSELNENLTPTQLALEAIVEADLLMPWINDTAPPDDRPGLINHLYCIDKIRYARLSPDDLANLHRHDALTLIYSHFFSLDNIKLLGKLAAARRSATSPIAAPDDRPNILQDDYLKF